MIFKRSGLGAFRRSLLGARNAEAEAAAEIPYECFFEGVTTGRFRVVGEDGCNGSVGDARIIWTTHQIDVLPSPGTNRLCTIFGGSYYIHPGILFEQRLEMRSDDLFTVSLGSSYRRYCYPLLECDPFCHPADCELPENNIHGVLMAVGRVEVDHQQYPMSGTDCDSSFEVYTRWDVVMYYAEVSGAGGTHTGEFAWFLTIFGYVLGPADSDTGASQFNTSIGILGTWRLTTAETCEASKVVSFGEYEQLTVADPWTGTWVKVTADATDQAGGPLHMDPAYQSDPPGIQPPALCGGAGSSWGNYLDFFNCCTDSEASPELTPCAFDNVYANVVGLGDECEPITGDGFLPTWLSAAELQPINDDTHLRSYRRVYTGAGVTVTWLLLPADEFLSPAWRLTAVVVATWGTLFVSWLQVDGSGSCGQGLWHPGGGQYEYEGHEAAPDDVCFTAALVPTIVGVSA